MAKPWLRSACNCYRQFEVPAGSLPSYRDKQQRTVKDSHKGDRPQCPWSDKIIVTAILEIVIWPYVDENVTRIAILKSSLSDFIWSKKMKRITILKSSLSDYIWSKYETYINSEIVIWLSFFLSFFFFWRKNLKRLTILASKSCLKFRLECMIQEMFRPVFCGLQTEITDAITPVSVCVARRSEPVWV